MAGFPRLHPFDIPSHPPSRYFPHLFEEGGLPRNVRVDSLRVCARRASRRFRHRFSDKQLIHNFPRGRFDRDVSNIDTSRLRCNLETNLYEKKPTSGSRI